MIISKRLIPIIQAPAVFFTPLYLLRTILALATDTFYDCRENVLYSLYTSCGQVLHLLQISYSYVREQAW